MVRLAEGLLDLSDKTFDGYNGLSEVQLPPALVKFDESAFRVYASC
jgi:hypothetical protein